MMGRLQDNISARIEVASSHAGQYAPWLAGRVTGLVEDSDVILRWHLAKDMDAADPNMVTIPNHAGAKSHKINTWGRYLLAVDARDIRNALSHENDSEPERVLAMAHMIGEVGLTGENTRHPDRPFLHKLSDSLVASLSISDRSEVPAYYGAVVRVGEGPYIGGIGTVARDNPQDFQSMPTYYAPVAFDRTPSGLNRV